MPELDSVRELNNIYNKVYSLSVYVKQLPTDEEVKKFLELKIDDCCNDITELQRIMVQEIDNNS